MTRFFTLSFIFIFTYIAISHFCSCTLYQQTHHEIRYSIILLIYCFLFDLFVNVNLESLLLCTYLLFIVSSLRVYKVF